MSSSGHAREASRAYDPRQIRLPNERTLAYCLYGPEGGTPVLFQYGMPGTMFLAPERLSPLDDLGIRLVVPARPGYGQSTRLPGRSVAAVAGACLVGVIAIGIHRARTASKRRRSERWRMLRRAWMHPEQIARPEETMLGKIARGLLLGAARMVVTRLVGEGASSAEKTPVTPRVAAQLNT